MGGVVETEFQSDAAPHEEIQETLEASRANMGLRLNPLDITHFDIVEEMLAF